MIPGRNLDLHEGMKRARMINSWVNRKYFFKKIIDCIKQSNNAISGGL